jgi:sulfur carrier protein
MRILVNGAWRETIAAELSSVLQELGYGEAVVATAVNGEFVAAGVRAGTRLAEGDRVEVLAPMQGG